MNAPAPFRFLAANRLATVGLAMLGVLSLAAALAPWISPYEAQATFAPLLRPSPEHPLGTNDLGYDLWTEFLLGARFSLALGISSALASTFVGLLVGLFAAYFQRLGFILMRLVDALLALPRFPLIILLAGFARPGFSTLLAFFTLFGWPTTARVVYARARSERAGEHITAAKAVGVPEVRLLFRYLLPPAVPIAFVRLVGEMQHVIMAESGLAFLGLGDPTMRSWGMTLSHAFRYPAILLTDVWTWWALPPGLAITAVCVALVFIGLALEPLSNPRLR